MTRYRAKLTGNIGKNWLLIQAGESFTWDGEKVTLVRKVRERGVEADQTLTADYNGREPKWWQKLDGEASSGDGAAATAAAPTLSDLDAARDRAGSATQAARAQREAKGGQPEFTGPGTQAAKAQRKAKAEN